MSDYSTLYVVDLTRTGLPQLSRGECLHIPALRMVRAEDPMKAVESHIGRYSFSEQDRNEILAGLREKGVNLGLYAFSQVEINELVGEQVDSSDLTLAVYMAERAYREKGKPSRDSDFVTMIPGARHVLLNADRVSEGKCIILQKEAA